MHMSDALLSPQVSFAAYAASGAALALAAAYAKKENLSEERLPLMGVLGAFVFAAQMINFTIPATGSSGHIGGGILLASLLGGPCALLVMAVVLVIQCLFFADGGLLALGANIFNMGVVPCLFVYPLVFKRILRGGATNRRLFIASVVSVAVALQAGAFAVVLETCASGIAALPFSSFVLLMLPIHFAIGLAEGFVTWGVLSFVLNARPELLEANCGAAPGVSAKKTVAAFAVAAIAAGVVLSNFASQKPDGLEWSVEKVAGTSGLEANGAVFDAASAVLQKTALMPDYDYASETNAPLPASAAAGFIGSAITFACAAAVAFLLTCRKKSRRAGTR